MLHVACDYIIFLKIETSSMALVDPLQTIESSSGNIDNSVIPWSALIARCRQDL